MDARIHALPFDPATLRGLSATLMQRHHQNNYGGAVKRLNAIRAQLAATPIAGAAGFLLNGLKREEFVAMGKAQGGGSGWALLAFQPREGSLVNQ